MGRTQNEANMIKQLTLQNKSEIQHLFLKVFSSPPWNDKWDSQAQLDHYMHDLIDNPNALVFGYFLGDALVGISLGYVFHWWQGTDYFIKEFCIDNSLQSQGIGTQFLSAIENELKTRDISAIWLMTERSVPAFEFYKRKGFFELEDSVVLAKNISSKEL